METYVQPHEIFGNSHETSASILPTFTRPLQNGNKHYERLTLVSPFDLFWALMRLMRPQKARTQKCDAYISRDIFDRCRDRCKHSRLVLSFLLTHRRQQAWGHA